MAYTGSVDLISGIRPKNGGSFPLVNVHDVYVNDDSRLDDVLAHMVPIGWSDLKALRDAGTLVPGRQYRITDYVATANGDMSSQSANHPFDIIVTADATNKLNEAARAIIHDGDLADDIVDLDTGERTKYFADCSLAAWRIGYCLDNDTTRFAWAVADGQTDAVTGTGGRGVIYRMVDEFGNDVHYDFKGLKFLAYGYSDGVYRYTFDSGDADGNTDKSLAGGSSRVYDNRIGVYAVAGTHILNRIVFKGSYCYSNTFGDGCNSNTFGGGCNSNTFGDRCSINTFGSNCALIEFRNGSATKNYVSYVTVESGNQHIILDLRGTSSSFAPYRNVTVKAGVNNSNSTKTIRDDANGGQTFNTIFKPANSQEISL